MLELIEEMAVTIHGCENFTERDVFPFGKEFLQWFNVRFFKLRGRYAK